MRVRIHHVREVKRPPVVVKPERQVVIRSRAQLHEWLKRVEEDARKLGL